MAWVSGRERGARRSIPALGGLRTEAAVAVGRRAPARASGVGSSCQSPSHAGSSTRSSAASTARSTWTRGAVTQIRICGPARRRTRQPRRGILDLHVISRHDPDHGDALAGRPGRLQRLPGRPYGCRFQRTSCHPYCWRISSDPFLIPRGSATRKHHWGQPMPLLSVTADRWNVAGREHRGASPTSVGGMRVEPARRRRGVRPMYGRN